MLDDLVRTVAILDALEVDESDVTRYIADNADARLSDLLSMFDFRP
jgi:hypothetical protein